MDPGILALAGVFGLGLALLGWSMARTRATARKLVEAGFTPCDAEAPALTLALTDVMGGHAPAPRRIHQVGRCFKRPGGWGHVYHLGVVDRTHAADAHTRGDHAATGGRFDLYLIDLADPERVASGPVSVFFAPRAPRPLQLLLEKLVESDPRGVPLEIEKSARTQSFIAAFGAAPGKLDERLPAATQERLARAAALGFLSAHFAAGKLALAAAPDRPDVQQQLAYVGEWA
jgi:hypothetical protein